MSEIKNLTPECVWKHFDALTKVPRPSGHLFEKSDLFKGIVMGGVLPRKTFSMGHAEEKRYYMECRNILGEE